jgi:hypothetical protein
MPTKLLKVNLRGVFIFVFTILISTAWAGDERSIKELRDALVALSPDVDPGEAELFSVTVHTMARSLAKEYRLVWCPPFQNLLINMGLRQRGYCAHFARDIGTRLKELKFKTLVLHWGAAYAGQADESNCLVVTARNQVFQNGFVIDAWRRGGGRLFWCALKKDHEYELEQHYGHSGITAWKEDMQETAWLQDNEPSKPEPQEASANH